MANKQIHQLWADVVPGEAVERSWATGCSVLASHASDASALRGHSHRLEGQI